MRRNIYIKVRVSEDEKKQIDELWYGDVVSEKVRVFLLSGPKTLGESRVKDIGGKEDTQRYREVDMPNEAAM